CANVLLKKYPNKIKKVFIVDFDVHHGNATQDIFYGRNDVCFFSIHAYDNGSFYPYSGNFNETGRGKGTGYNINVPLNSKVGDQEYLEVFNTLLMPIISSYQPDII